jgi:hypothetical protein
MKGGSGRSKTTFVTIIKGKAQKSKNGREKGNLADSAAKHQALLALLQATLNALNGSKSASE